MTTPVASTSSDYVATQRKVNKTVVDEATPQLNDYRSEKSVRVTSEYGKVVEKGGQYLGIDFWNSIFRAYFNLVNRPFALASFLIVILYYCNHLVTSGHVNSNPYHLAAHNVHAFGNKTQSTVGKSVAWVIFYVLNIINVNADFFTMLLAVWFPFFAKSSKANATLAGMFTLYWIFYLDSHGAIFAFSQGFFLFTQMRDPKSKFFVIMITILCCLLGSSFVYQLFNVKELSANYNLTGGAIDEKPVLTPKPDLKSDSVVSTTTLRTPTVNVHNNKARQKFDD